LPPEVQALDGAFRQFFDQVHDLGAPLANVPDSLGVSSWLLAGATMVGAFEVARRRQAGGPLADVLADGTLAGWIALEGPHPGRTYEP
jgi:hypothetical protein